MYGSMHVAGWAAALLETAPFQRLAGVSLSDVPGPLLFGRPFPSRLDHAIGVYHLTRLARPRDRALQASALAHDLGHGPFSHLTEPLMLERLGIDHEQRSARLVFDVRDALAPWIQRYLDWLDWDEVAALVQGQGADGRGALLNGLLDYDNIDNIARFLAASGLGSPGYDPVTLARGLTLSAANSSDDEMTPVMKLAASVADEARAGNMIVASSTTTCIVDSATWRCMRCCARRLIWLRRVEVLRLIFSIIPTTRRWRIW